MLSWLRVEQHGQCLYKDTITLSFYTTGTKLILYLPMQRHNNSECSSVRVAMYKVRNVGLPQFLCYRHKTKVYAKQMYST